MKKSIGFEIKTVSNMLARKILQDSKLKNGFAISHVQIKIVHYLAENFRKKKIVYQRDIEKALSVRRSTVSGILQTMEKNNFIKRIPVKEDARLKQIVLTDKAKKIAKEMKKKANSFDYLLSNGISYEELTIFFKVIDKIKENISNG